VISHYCFDTNGLLLVGIDGFDGWMDATKKRKRKKHFEFFVDWSKKLFRLFDWV